VLTTQTCFVVSNLLRGVILHGTGMAALDLGRPAAGKTGTTNEFTDAWFVGYTPQLVAGVWVGYDDHSPLGNKNTGGKVACPIWTNFMRNALAGEPVQQFNTPEDVVFTLIDPKSGLLALSRTPGAYLEAFLKGTEPKGYYFKNEETKETQIATPKEEENAPATDGRRAVNQIGAEEQSGF
jgi:penicillin-binding protein 1A